ncbi:hypothetical protein NEMIN01_0851 [Nematocida minor]|uniref:uncharacterized protein n=1 Tax=Nematocida minor TaxID=1912983 RepID=UPI00221F80F3|nr:uncharacterized protein NEMIN01_0851 [Nematocida minor]KAI5190066.1 hypothetical protein NEMIN01_0851 [Nematocida minor]
MTLANDQVNMETLNNSAHPILGQSPKESIEVAITTSIHRSRKANVLVTGVFVTACILAAMCIMLLLAKRKKAQKEEKTLPNEESLGAEAEKESKQDHSTVDEHGLHEAGETKQTESDNKTDNALNKEYDIEQERKNDTIYDEEASELLLGCIEETYTDNPTYSIDADFGPYVSAAAEKQTDVHPEPAKEEERKDSEGSDVVSIPNSNSSTFSEINGQEGASAEQEYCSIPNEPASYDDKEDKYDTESNESFESVKTETAEQKIAPSDELESDK